MAHPKILVALDYENRSQAMELVAKLNPEQCRMKIGKEMFTRYGPAIIEDIQRSGFDVFLDLKYHDIPNTVAKACAAAADLGVWMVNVHALGGQRMLEAAAEAVAAQQHKPLLIAVTVLTSMSAEDLAFMGINKAPGDFAIQLAGMAKNAGLDGVVCSAQEAATMKSHLGEAFILVTPGIRPSGSASDDQRRIMTPAEAIKAGSDYLVIGRPVTQSEDPVSVLLTINSEIS